MFLWRAVLALLFVYEATGFQSHKIFTATTTNDIAQRAAPLKTAGGMYSVIPRLEPGLRVLRSSKFLASFDPSEISAISLNLMNQIMMKRDEKHGVLSQEELGALQREQYRVSMETLFHSAKNSVATFTMRFYSFVKKLVATSVLAAGGFKTPVVSPATAMRTASLATASIAATIMAGPKRIAQAAISSTVQLLGTRKYQSLSAMQRLGTTPVYFVANSRGNAFLQEDLQTGNPEQKIIVYFMSSEDAMDYLEEMAQSNPTNAQEFNLVTTTLEKVVDNIVSKKQSRKLGRYPMDVIYRIQPSSRQVENAALVTQKAAQFSRVKKSSATAPVSVPMFSAPGLVIKRSSGELVTPYYFALEDLQEDWAKMVASTQATTNAPAQPPQIMVRDFTEVMCLAQGISRHYVEGKDLTSALESLVQVSSGNNAVATTSDKNAAQPLSVKEIKSALETPGFVAPRREIDMVKRYYRQQQGFPGEFSRVKLTIRPE